MITCVVDVFEGRNGATCDIVGVYLHAEMTEKVHMIIWNKIVDIWVAANNENYERSVYTTKTGGIFYILYSERHFMVALNVYAYFGVDTLEECSPMWYGWSIVLHAEMTEKIHMIIRNKMVDTLVASNKEKYERHVYTMKRGNPAYFTRKCTLWLPKKCTLILGTP